MTKKPDGWLLRAALRVVPASWRESVRQDLREEAAGGVLAGWWCAVEAASVGISLHWVFTRDSIMADLRYAIRSILHARWFAIGAVFTFALGIGVSVAVFSAVDRMLFRRMPYANADRLVLLEEFDRRTGLANGTLPAPLVVEAQKRIAAIAGVATVDNIFYTAAWTTPEPGDAPAVTLSEATFNILAVCGVSPVLGRGFDEEDARAKRAVALLAYETWKSRFGGTPNILNMPLYLDGKRVEIVGVLPAGFIPPGQNLDPRSMGLLLNPSSLTSAGPRDRFLAPVVLLTPGALPAAVESSLQSIYTEIGASLPPPPPGRTPAPQSVRLNRLDQIMFSWYRPYLQLVVVAGALVLLIACTNLASLFVARGRARELDAAIRSALGASATRLVLTSVFESACVCAIGGAVAWVALLWSSKAIAILLPPVFARFAAGVTDLRVISFALATAFVCTVLAGVIPGVRLARTDVLPALRRSSGYGRTRHSGAGRTLLVVEAALGVFLVAGAAVTTRSFLGLVRTDLGFSPQDLYSVNVRLSASPDPAVGYAASEQALDVLRHHPGVQSASAAANLFTIGQGGTPLSADLGRQCCRWVVSAGYFDTFGIPVRAGRAFTSVDAQTHANVAILSERAVALFWPDARPASAVGQILRSTGEPDREVIGVVADFREGYASESLPALYLPLTDQGFRRMMFVARMRENMPLSLSALRQAVRDRVGATATVTISSVEVRLDAGLQNPRFRAFLFGVFAIVALLIAAVGLYAVAAFDVALRQRELGVRLTLGASAMQIRTMVIRDTVRPVAIGSLVGLIGAWWAARFVQAFLYKVDARDPWTLALVAGVLLATATVAAWLPARRAARVDPAVVLRGQ